MVAGARLQNLLVSANGHRVAHVADQEAASVFELYGVSLAGGTLTQLNPTLVAGGAALQRNRALRNGGALFNYLQARSQSSPSGWRHLGKPGQVFANGFEAED